MYLPVALVRSGPRTSPEQGRALAYPTQPVAPPGPRYRGGERVAHRQLERAVADRDTDPDRHGPRVSQHVGQSLLKDAVPLAGDRAGHRVQRPGQLGVDL